MREMSHRALMGASTVSLEAFFEMLPERGESHSVLCICILDGVDFSVWVH